MNTFAMQPDEDGTFTLENATVEAVNPLAALGDDVVGGALDRVEERTKMEADKGLVGYADALATGGEKAADLEEQAKESHLGSKVRSKLFALGLFTAGMGGAYLLWKALQKDTKDTSEPQNESTSGAKTLAYLAVGTGGLLALGSKFAPDKLGDLVTFAGVSFSDASYDKFIEKAKAGKYIEALRSFRFVTDDPGIISASENLKIDPSVLCDLQNVQYSDANSWSGRIWTEGGAQAVGLLEMMGYDSKTEIPFFGADDALRRCSATKELMAHIEANKDRIPGDLNEMTLGEIMTSLFADVTDEEAVTDEETDAEEESTFANIFSGSPTECMQKLKEMVYEGSAFVYDGVNSFIVSAGKVIGVNLGPDIDPETLRRQAADASGMVVIPGKSPGAWSLSGEAVTAKNAEAIERHMEMAA